MKKLLILSALTLAIFSACKPIDPVEEKAEYTNCVVYSVDTLTSVGVATDYARIKVTADMSTMLFQLGFSDLKLQPGGELQNVTVRGLTQYLKDVENPFDGQTDYLYTFFKTDGPAYTDGMSVRNLRFGWLSTVYWCTFATGQCRVWALPKNVQTYANKNVLTDIRENEFIESAIHPRYDFTIDAVNNTLSINGSGIKFQTTNDGSNEIEFRNQYLIEGLNISYNYKGFTASAAELWPTADGSRNRYKITDFYLQFDADYDGEREARYTLTDTSNGESYRIVSTFGYNNQRNY